MVLYGNNYNRKFSLSTAVLAALAAVIINLTRNTVTDIQASNGVGEAHSLDAAGVALLLLASALLVLIAVLGILFTFVKAHIWPVDVKDLLRVMAGHPGSLFELANKCNRCGVSYNTSSCVYHRGALECVDHDVVCCIVSLACTISSLSLYRLPQFTIHT